MKKFISYSFLMFLIFACNGEKVSGVKNNPQAPPIKEHLVNWTFFNSEGLQNISFPIWFNDSLVTSKNIKKIHIDINEFEPQQDSSFHDTIPSTQYEVDFSNGTINMFYVKEFSQEIAIEEQWFRYRNKKDSLGYSLPAITNNVIYAENDFLPIFTTLQNAQHYKRLKIGDIDSSVVHYVNTLSVNNEQHVFIKDTANWNVHFIDQKFEHPEKIVFYFGLPTKHLESFKIQNLVEKSKLSSNKYFENGCIYQHSTYSNGFENRRTFLYDTKGEVTGYIDSLVVEPNDFIERIISKVKYKNGLPSVVSSHKTQDSLFKEPIKEIRLNYVFNE
jgi:hypothetical protein